MEIDLLNNALFKEDKIEFPKNVNFLYGRNGTGKSTLSKEIRHSLEIAMIIRFLPFKGLKIYYMEMIN